MARIAASRHFYTKLLIKQIDGKGCVVMVDAMNTQKETVKAFIEEAHRKLLPCIERKPENGIS